MGISNFDVLRTYYSMAQLTSVCIQQRMALLLSLCHFVFRRASSDGTCRAQVGGAEQNTVFGHSPPWSILKLTLVYKHVFFLGFHQPSNGIVDLLQSFQLTEQLHGEAVPVAQNEADFHTSAFGHADRIRIQSPPSIIIPHGFYQTFRCALARCRSVSVALLHI